MLLKDIILLGIKELFSVDPVMVFGKSRLAVYLPARFAVCLVLRNRGWSYPQIAQITNRKCHTTILNSVQRAEQMVQDDPEYAIKIEKLTEKIVNHKGK